MTSLDLGRCGSNQTLDVNRLHRVFEMMAMSKLGPG